MLFSFTRAQHVLSNHLIYIYHGIRQVSFDYYWQKYREFKEGENSSGALKGKVAIYSNFKKDNFYVQSEDLKYFSIWMCPNSKVLATFYRNIASDPRLLIMYIFTLRCSTNVLYKTYWINQFKRKFKRFLYNSTSTSSYGNYSHEKKRLFMSR